jgi:peptidoglycan/LPS O-acetylase OafA/YrhL
MSVTADKKERFHFLDGLRGIAASMVVIHHAFTANIVKGLDHLGIQVLSDFFKYFTQSGVDLFFVLSGVVLLRPYLRRQREFKVGDYFVRRIKRIYPPYFFAVLFAAFVVWFNNQYATWYNVQGMHAQFSWLETLKELVIINFDGVYYNLAWWSLQIEILFYLVAPLIVFIFLAQKKAGPWRMVVSICATLIVAYAVQFYCTDHLPKFYSYTYQVSNFSKFIEYPLCFLLGVYLAARDFSLRQGGYFVVAGVVLLFAGLVYMHHSLIYLSVLHGGYGLFYAGVIVMAFNVQSFKKMLSSPFMIWLGERSYSLFLVHFSVFYLTDNIISHFTADRSALYGILTRVCGIPLALFGAMLLFYFVERKQARGLMTDKLFWPWQAGRLKG